jgi:RNA polymerase sigma-70 factor, ECF subfamily
MQLSKWIGTPTPRGGGMGSSALPPPPLPPVQRELFAVLFRAHRPDVRRMAQRAGIHAADEADVIQEVFLALHRAIGRGLDVSAPLGGWLKRATFRRAKDLRKLARCGREVLTPKGEIDAADGGPSPEANMVAIDARRLVLELLDELPDELRLVLVMSDAEEMPMSEIAEVLEIPEGTGYTRLRAARRDFEAAWNRRREAQAPRAAALGVAPFLLFDAQALFDVGARSIPDESPELHDRAWSRLVHALGPALQDATTLAAVAGAAAAAGAAAKGAAVLLTAKQIAIGVVLSMGVGAALHAALRPTSAAPEDVAITRDATHAAAALPSASVSETWAPVASATAAPVSPEADAGAVMDVEQAERNVIARARGALARAALAQDNKARAHELAVALAALDEHEKRFKSPLLAEAREALRRQALLFQQAHTTQDGGHP